jgi:hypothetical protein
VIRIAQEAGGGIQGFLEELAVPENDLLVHAPGEHTQTDDQKEEVTGIPHQRCHGCLRIGPPRAYR